MARRSNAGPQHLTSHMGPDLEPILTVAPYNGPSASAVGGAQAVIAPGAQAVVDPALIGVAGT